MLSSGFFTEWKNDNQKIYYNTQKKTCAFASFVGEIKTRAIPQPHSQKWNLGLFLYFLFSSTWNWVILAGICTLYAPREASLPDSINQNCHKVVLALRPYTTAFVVFYHSWQSINGSYQTFWSLHWKIKVKECIF